MESVPFWVSESHGCGTLCGHCGSHAVMFSLMFLCHFFDFLSQFWTLGHHVGTLGQKVGVFLAQGPISDDLGHQRVTPFWHQFWPWATLLRELGRRRPKT